MAPLSGANLAIIIEIRKRNADFGNAFLSYVGKRFLKIKDYVWKVPGEGANEVVRFACCSLIFCREFLLIKKEYLYLRYR